MERSDVTTLSFADINALTGRELDYAVGRELFGYRVYHYSKGLPEYYCLINDEYSPLLITTPKGRWETYKDCERQSEEMAWGDCPMFSDGSDMEATWYVVTRLMQSGWILHVQSPETTPRLGRWQIVLTHADLPSVAEDGDTFSETVCKAALLSNLVHW